jgi:hypothetical protein
MMSVIMLNVNMQSVVAQKVCWTKIYVLLHLKDNDVMHFSFKHLSNTSTVVHKPRISVLLKPAV